MHTTPTESQITQFLSQIISQIYPQDISTWIVMDRGIERKNQIFVLILSQNKQLRYAINGRTSSLLRGSHKKA